MNIVAAAIKEDHRMTYRVLASSNGVSYGTKNKILHDNLDVVKKSACWMPELLSDNQKKESDQLQEFHCCRQPLLHDNVG